MKNFYLPTQHSSLHIESKKSSLSYLQSICVLVIVIAGVTSVIYAIGDPNDTKEKFNNTFLNSQTTPVVGLN
ncbi:MAG: hypothetical protein QM526_00170 [Alphaproteobacteria bacterium]|nr:hypothetical protein [Alphaproteobacteria bacterium]